MGWGHLQSGKLTDLLRIPANASSRCGFVPCLTLHPLMAADIWYHRWDSFVVRSSLFVVGKSKRKTYRLCREQIVCDARCIELD